MSKTAKLSKAACGLNLAVLLRAVRFGPRDAARTAVRAMMLSILARIPGSGAFWPTSPGLAFRR